MPYKETNLGIVLDDYREAALFFEYVVPIFNTIDFPTELLPRGIRNLPGQAGNLLYEFEKLTSKGRKYYWQEPEFGNAQNNPNYYSEIFPYLVRAIPKFIKKFEDNKILCVPVLPEDYSFYIKRTGFEAISIISTNVARVNTKNISWFQIKEFRKDESSVRALKNYRLFWYDNYRDSSIAYINDHLELKYRKFRRACKKHGFNIIHVTLTNLLQSKSLLSASAITLASTVMNEPKIGFVALASGIAIDIGKTSINIAKIQLEKETLVKNSELAYLSKLNDKFT